MKETIDKDLKLKTRVWRLFEVLPLDADDYDYDFDWGFEGRSRPKKKKPKTAVELDKLVENNLTWNVIFFTAFKLGWSHLWKFRTKYPFHELQNSLCRKAERGLESRLHKYAEFDAQCRRPEVRDMVNKGELCPELDTVRVYWDCSSVIRLDDFIADSSTRECYSVSRNPLGDISHQKTYFRSEFKCSWWGKMTVTKELRPTSKRGEKRPVLSFEFSVAKWFHYASAVNSGEAPCADLILMPCIQALDCLGICRFSPYSFDMLVRRFCDEAEIRRMDLSLNFKVPYAYTATDYVKLISKCYINRQRSHEHADGSISFATEESPYRVIVYDKEKEAERYYNDWKSCQRYVYFEDEDGNHFRTQNAGASLKEIEVDEFAEKQKFYENNSHLFKNNLRFEVQFRTKFFKEHDLMTQGKDNIDNVIRLGKFVWAELLDQIDQQLGRTNFAYKDSQKEPVANALQKIEDRKVAKIYSRTKANNMIGFIKDCYLRSWQEVYNEIGRSLFYNYRKWVLDEVGYDVKICVAQSNELPIMRIMESFAISREGRMIESFRLMPAPVERLVV